MSTENKNQVTLYKFVSLRSASLSKKENEQHRFVFHPDNKSGKYFDVVRDKPVSQTKWSAMLNLNFKSYKFESDIESLNPAFYKIAKWIANNKNDLDETKLLGMIKTLTAFAHKNPTDVEMELWDNLFYQTVTQNSFYIKETLIEVLILQNILKNTKDLRDDEILLLLPTLVNAKVVLPEVLFDSTINSLQNNEIEANDGLPVFLNKPLLDAQLIQSSKNTIERLESLEEELRIAEKNYFFEYQKNYKLAFDANQLKNAPLIADYKKRYFTEKKRLISGFDTVTFDKDDIRYRPEIDLPVLEIFNFKNPVEINATLVKSKLSAEALEVFNPLLGTTTLNTFTEAISLVEKAIEKENLVISQNTIVNQKKIAIGGLVFTGGQTFLPSSSLPYQICSTKGIRGKVVLYMSIEMPSSNYVVDQFSYHLHYGTNPMVSNSFHVSSYNGNVLTLSNLFNGTLTLTQGTGLTKITGTIKFTNGKEYNFEKTPFTLSGCHSGRLVLKKIPISSEGGSNQNNNFIPKGFGYRQLGIADYKKVVAQICCYEPGEVAHIENVMASELRSKVTTKTYKSEVTDFQGSEIEKENMTDLVSTERFEMQTEVAKLLSEQKQVSAYADVHSSWGNTTLDAGVSYASNTAKEESNRQAVTEAKELTQRAVERIVSRVRTEKTVKITNEFVEENTHVFDNRGAEHHISGVYRFINAVYENSIHNYGKRLMYEFTVPQPGKLHQLAMEVEKSDTDVVVIEQPINPASLGITDFTKITPSNYQSLASKYNAEVEVFPVMYTFLNKTVSSVKLGGNEVIEGSSDIQIPLGYKPMTAKLKFAASWDKDSLDLHSVNIAFGNYSLFCQEVELDITEINLTGFQHEYEMDNFTEKINFSYALANYLSCNISLSIKIKITDEKLEEWKKGVYNAILKGYQEKLRIYNEELNKVKEEASKILDSNPLFYRDIEQTVLRKNCISYLLDNSATSARRFGQKMYSGNSLLNYQIMANADMDRYGSFVKFMEQAFEWKLMSYNFYPYYWGYDADWSSMYQFETNDPIFRSFMQAGMARVVVTVRPGFEDAVMHYMTTGQIWNGGQTPILNDPLYRSIVDELKEQEYTVKETWKTVVPTHLIGLQRSGVSVDQDGLPCSCPTSEGLNRSLGINDKTLKAKSE